MNTTKNGEYMKKNWSQVVPVFIPGEKFSSWFAAEASPTSLHVIDEKRKLYGIF